MRVGVPVVEPPELRAELFLDERAKVVQRHGFKQMLQARAFAGRTAAFFNEYADDGERLLSRQVSVAEPIFARHPMNPHCDCAYWPRLVRWVTYLS